MSEKLHPQILDSALPPATMLDPGAAYQETWSAIMNANPGDRIHIKGVAGSGKTSLALALAVKHGTASRMLYINPHRRLCEWFKQLLQEKREAGSTHIQQTDVATSEELVGRVESLSDWNFQSGVHKAFPTATQVNPILLDSLAKLRDPIPVEELGSKRPTKRVVGIVNLVLDVVKRFTWSTESHITATHLKPAQFTEHGRRIATPFTETTDDSQAVQNALDTRDKFSEQSRVYANLRVSQTEVLKLAQALWIALSDPRSPLPLSFDIAIKVLQLHGAVLASNYDWIFLDDAERTTPALVSILCGLHSANARLIISEGLYPFQPTSTLSSSNLAQRSFFMKHTFRFNVEIATAVNQLEKAYRKIDGDTKGCIGLYSALPESNIKAIYAPLPPTDISRFHESLTCIGSKKDLLLFGIQLCRLIDSGRLSMFRLRAPDVENLKVYAQAIMEGWDLFVVTRVKSLRDQIPIPPKLALFSDFRELLYAVSERGDRRFQMIADFAPAYERILRSLIKTNGTLDAVHLSAVDAWKKEVQDLLRALESTCGTSSPSSISKMAKLSLASEESSDFGIRSTRKGQLEGCDLHTILLITPLQAKGLEWDNVALLEDFFDVHDHLHTADGNDNSLQKTPEKPSRAEFTAMQRQLFPLFIAMTRARRKLFVNHQLDMFLKKTGAGFSSSSAPMKSKPSDIPADSS